MRALSLLTVLLLLPALAPGQVRSETSGLMLNGHLNGSAVSVEDSDDIENGGGLGLAVGWGFSPSWMIYAAGDGASISGAGSSQDYSLGHFDLGIRYSFADPKAPGFPFSRPPSADARPSGPTSPPVRT